MLWQVHIWAGAVVFLRGAGCALDVGVDRLTACLGWTDKLVLLTGMPSWSHRLNIRPSCCKVLLP